MRQLNDESLALIKQWEGCVLYAYDDADTSRPRKAVKPGDPVRGTLTIGYGHTGSVRPGQIITEAEAERLLRADLAGAVNTVERLAEVPLSDNQFGALVSFVYNVGSEAFRSSTLLRRLNAGEYEAVPGELARWNKTRVNGRLVRSQGLANRRAAEAGLWVRGSHVASATVVAAAEPEPSTARDTLAVGGLAGVAAAVAPYVKDLAGLDTVVAVAVVAAVAAVAVAVVLTRRRRAAA